MNGDGYADAIVGASGKDSAAESSVGELYVFFGSASGLPTTFSLRVASPLDYANGFFANSCAGVGDVNGDGFADIVAGAPSQNTDGEAYLFYGASTGLATSSYESFNYDPGTPGFTQFGKAVSPAGDVNGDGFADVVVGAPACDAPETGEGCLFVYNGSIAGISVDPDQVIDNPADELNAKFGDSIASAGDVDGDGYWDVIVGATDLDSFVSNDGAAYVLRGSSAGLVEPACFVPNPYSQGGADWGVAVGTTGDHLNDGKANILVGAPFFDLPEMDEGISVVFLGADGTGCVPAMPARRVDNPTDQAFGSFGSAVAWAGDANGDGFGDYAVGASSQYLGAGSETGEGNVFIFYGGSGYDSVPALTLDNPTDQGGAHFGSSLGSAF